MPKRLEDVLTGKQANYILPLLWQKGEDEAVIREEMARVYESGIYAVCAEARPHPDFYGPRWWRDFDIIMEEARARGMRVWLLDDDHFPTGHAAGKMKDAPPELSRLFLHEGHLDVIGPQHGASFPLGPWSFDFRNPSPPGSIKFEAASAFPRDPASTRLTGAPLDLTANIQDNVLYWDIPEGTWRVFFLYSSPGGGSQHHKDYINMIVPESVRVQIDAVYEPLYARYADDFGKTFAGFFSDEPGFYNDPQTFDYNSALGKQGVPLPWRAGMLDLLSQTYGSDCRALLPLLWYGEGSTPGPLRYAYMDLVSRLYAEHFTNQLGDWCRAHGVEYIGHVLEDNGVHARLGPGPGHYFRGLWGQDMAGLDVVLWQLIPGFDEGPSANMATDIDGEFFHYGLGKLGSSLGHIDPKKKGRTMCEVFGAYGWREGLKLMKWMTDHLLVRGVNYFVPHAFSQDNFPDHDCPPHMYARGKNPQFRYYRILNDYTNRACHLLSGGLHIAPAAVLYHAEAEWSGESMPFQKPVRMLMQAQIDCDVLPADSLLSGAEVDGAILKVNEEQYQLLVIPAAEALPARLLARLAVFADLGLPVLFVERMPSRASENTDASSLIDRLASHPKIGVVPLAELAARATELGITEIAVSERQPSLRVMHIRQADSDVTMFFNEHPYRSIETQVSLPGELPAVRYDALENQAGGLTANEENGRLHFKLKLSPYESIFVLTGPAARQKAASLPAVPVPAQPAVLLTVPGPWNIETADSQQYPAFISWRESQPLGDLSRPDALPTFSGTFRYTTSLTTPELNGPVQLDLGEVYETAEVWLNGQRIGTRICPPYTFDVTGLLRSGLNELVVEVTNTLVKNQQDFLSRYAPQEPSGLIGPVMLVGKGR